MSALENHVDDYLRLRRALGYDLEETGRLLHRFAAELDAAGVTHITTQVAVRWALAPKVSAPSSVPATRYRAVRGFARYMAGIDPETEIPPAGLIRHPRSRRPPFIYTDEERARVARAGASGRSRSRCAPRPMQTLIGLLATTRPAGRGGAAPGPRRHRSVRRGAAHPRIEVRQVTARAAARPASVEALERYDHTRQIALLPDPAPRASSCRCAAPA